AALAAGAPAGIAVVLRAGAHDHYLARAGGPGPPAPPGGLDAALAGAPSVRIDGDGVSEAVARLGEAALAGLPAALLALACARLAHGAADDAALLVPGYVALPRGVDPMAQEQAWSPDLR